VACVPFVGTHPTQPPTHCQGLPVLVTAGDYPRPSHPSPIVESECVPYEGRHRQGARKALFLLAIARRLVSHPRAFFFASLLFSQVGDLGIAKALSSSMDMAKTQIGTPYYLSPEICCDRPYNRKSDMWALGVILYELLTLSLPFTASALPALVSKILAGSYTPVPALRYSAPLRGLVDALLARDPRQRPSVNAVLRMEFMRDRLARFLTQTLAAREFGSALQLAGPPQPPARSRSGSPPTRHCCCRPRWKQRSASRVVSLGVCSSGPPTWNSASRCIAAATAAPEACGTHRRRRRRQCAA
jgi:serine/threonine protein kinase